MTVIPTRKGNLWRALAAGIFCLVCCGISTLQAAEVAGCDEDSLLDAINTDGVALFTEDCDITLSGTMSITGDVIVDAQGHNVTISGDGTFLLFEITNEISGSIQFYGIGFSGGSNTNGGAFYIDGLSSAAFSNCVFSGNVAANTNGFDGVKGSDSSTGNGGSGTNGKNGGAAYGGAIYSLGSLGLVNCSFFTNSATGGNGGNGGNGGSGHFNAGDGGNGGAGAAAKGGAVYCEGSDMVISNCTFSGNSIAAGNGGTGGAKGASGLGGLDGNGGAGAPASGAAIYSTTPIIVVNSTFDNNSAQGGDSAAGGLQLNGNGTDGANGGNSFGGGIYAAGSSVTNCTFFNNNVSGGAGGNGGNGRFNAGHGGNGGNATGGGLYSFNGTAVVSCTFSNCNATGGTNGIAGTGLAPVNGTKGASRGGDLASGGSSFDLFGTILATNRSGGAGFGTIHDSGYNITFGNTITIGASSLKNVDPKLGTLSSNGGPTMTMALLANSPARDKVPFDANTDVKFDQRGLPRPINGTNDIGAFEYQAAGEPIITVQPTNSAVQFGSNASFTIGVSGASPFTYRLILNGNLPPAQTKVLSSASAPFTVTNVTLSNSGVYQITVSNLYGVAASRYFSNRFVPTIVTNPANRTVSANDPVTFSVTAIGDPVLVYQWQFAGTNIPAATNASYLIAHAQTTNVGSYQVIVTNGFGSVTSAPARLDLLASIQTNPTNQTVAQGSTVIFSVVAAGSPPLSYQWRLNGAPLANATASAYQIDGVTTNKAGTYDVVVTNQFNSVTSAPAILTVQTNFGIIQSGLSGNNFTFTFPTAPGHTYYTEYRTNIVLGGWVPLVTNQGNGFPMTITSALTNSPSRFFRVRVQ